eukprot:1172607-Prorocentrum_minimum.AAC.1
MLSSPLRWVQVVTWQWSELTNNNEWFQVTNMDNCYPSRQVITMLSVTTRNLTLDGPITLVQSGQSAFIMRHPIFVNVTLAAEADPWGHGPVNETFGRSY